MIPMDLPFSASLMLELHACTTMLGFLKTMGSRDPSSEPYPFKASTLLTKLSL